MPQERDSIVISFAGTGGMQAIPLRCLTLSSGSDAGADDDVQQFLAGRRREGERREAEELFRLHAGAHARSVRITETLYHTETVDGHLAMDLATTSTYSAVSYEPPLLQVQSPDSERLERAAAKVNFEIENRASETARNISFRMTVGSHEGHFVVMERDDPQVVRTAEGYAVSEDMGDVEGGTVTKVFREALRILVGDTLAGRRIPFTVEIRGADLPAPVVAILYGEATADRTPE